MGFGKDVFQNTVTGVAGSVAGAIGNELGYQLGNLTGSNERRRKEQLKQQQALTDMQRNAQSGLMKESYALQKEMWDSTNYEAQMEHIKAAGLNPALLYGQGGGGGTTTGSGGASVGGGQASGEAERMNAQTAQTGMGLQLAKMKSEIAVNESVAEVNKAQAAKAGEETTTISAARNPTIEKIKAETENLAQLTANENVKNLGLEIDNKIKSLDEQLKSATLQDSAELIKQNVNEIKQNILKITAETAKTNTEGYILDKAKETLIDTYNQTLVNMITENVLKHKEIGLKSEQIINTVNDRVLSRIATMADKNYKEAQVVLSQALQNLQRELNQQNVDQSLTNSIINALSTISGAFILKGAFKGPEKVINNSRWQGYNDTNY